MIHELALAYQMSCKAALHPPVPEVRMEYRAGDPDWDESWDDDELEGGAYLDSSYAGRTADTRCRDE